MTEEAPPARDEWNELLSQYTEDGMKAAIEAAKDPRRAESMAARLDAFADDALADFTAAGLGIALGEAKVESAIPVLLKILAENAEDAGLMLDVASYALRRMGGPAFEAAMRFIETEPEHWERLCAYGLLCAAADEPDPVVRQRVADFCYGRLEHEMSQPWDDDPWNPGHAACEVLVWLRDPRVEPALKRAAYGADEKLPAADQRKPLAKFDEIAEELLLAFEKKEDPALTEPEWRTGWAEFCEPLAEAIDSANEDWMEDADDDDEDEEDDGWEDETETDPRRQAYKELLAEFAQSPFAAKLPCSPVQAEGYLWQLIDFGTEQVDEDFSFDNLNDVREVLLEWLPRKVSAPVEYFAPYPEILKSFARFLHEEGKLKDPAGLLALAAEAETELPARAADPTYWGPAKRLLMAGRIGHMPGDARHDLDAVARQMAQSIGLDLDAALQDPAPAVTVEPHTPIRRAAPKVGRNDPCPCGSGKKYKKCCGG